MFHRSQNTGHTGLKQHELFKYKFKLNLNIFGQTNPKI